MFRISCSSSLHEGYDEPEILRYENRKSVPQALTSDTGRLLSHMPIDHHTVTAIPGVPFRHQIAIPGPEFRGIRRAGRSCISPYGRISNRQGGIRDFCRRSPKRGRIDISAANVQQLIVAGPGPPHHHMIPSIQRTLRAMLVDDRFQFRCTRNRKDHIRDLAIRGHHRSRGDIDQQSFLAVDLLDVGGNSADHLAPGFRADPVNHIDQQVHQPINQVRFASHYIGPGARPVSPGHDGAFHRPFRLRHDAQSA